MHTSVTAGGSPKEQNCSKAATNLGQTETITAAQKELGPESTLHLGNLDRSITWISMVQRETCENFKSFAEISPGAFRLET